ncbi:hypothetical protein FZW96_13990 [Bacillus sp. BGMRC 2118]|nr:hypothetical protein FZW96_13990 [Bacillus sp. BGMRC 2118]
MVVKDLIENIHKRVEDLDLVTARKYIEDNIELLKGNRNLLKGNARELLSFIIARIESGEVKLAREEIATALTINKFATNFDLRSLKLAIKGKEQLLLSKEFIGYLNSDAKTILQGMGAIQK